MSETSAPFEVGRRTIDGREHLAGIARRAISRGERICVFQGEVFTFDEIVARIDRGESRSGDDPLELGPDRYVDLERPYLAFNHSCDPNAALVRERDLVAIRDIARGEEISYDYSLNIGLGNPYVMKFDCRCGSPRCRKRIANLATIPLEQLRRYYEAGAGQDYIRPQIEELLHRAADR